MTYIATLSMYNLDRRIKMSTAARFDQRVKNGATTSRVGKIVRTRPITTIKEGSKAFGNPEMRALFKGK